MFKYRVAAPDGAAGHVRDLLFDDHDWRVHYVVVDVHQGLSRRQVLISPACVHHADAGLRRLDVSLGREQIRRGPDVDAARPGDPHLQSVRAGRGYTVITRDAAAGHVVDFVVDCAAWTVTDVVVARHHWLAGPRLVLPVGAVEHVSWLGKAVYLDAEALGRTA